MKTNPLSKFKFYSALMLLLVAFSCQDDVAPPAAKQDLGGTMSVLEDGPFKDEMLSRVEGAEKSRPQKNGIALPPGPVFPAGYDYQNAIRVNLNGANWTHYVAWKLVGNTATNKEGIVMFYTKDGVFKNFIKSTWSKRSETLVFLTNMLPMDNFQHGLSWAIRNNRGVMATSPRWNTGPTGRDCGDATMDCFADLYANHGSLSILFTITTAFAPEMAVGVLGTCLLWSCI
ncbi:MAG: hypothetical protein WKF87_13450 [Chryseolinea sp.]